MSDPYKRLIIEAGQGQSICIEESLPKCYSVEEKLVRNGSIKLTKPSASSYSAYRGSDSSLAHRARSALKRTAGKRSQRSEKFCLLAE